ncbi:hypothetical protein BDN72DRAFT_959107 [Pluteus cervinus]|uniref:Uncharacterized protein n=1 Tax=Pluteus cervinus TaxID=181527 RepID=A0ACD3AXK8_9AGAR|nr:hypothetical protein BDN72DRAFT_959107 [Pluteus cervinus]
MATQIIPLDDEVPVIEYSHHKYLGEGEGTGLVHHEGGDSGNSCFAHDCELFPPRGTPASLRAGDRARLTPSSFISSTLEPSFASTSRTHGSGLESGVGVDGHLEATPPFERIPPEILEEIFLHFVKGGNSKPTWRVSESTEGPTGFDTSLLVWGNVCRYWRELSSSRPVAWSSISIRKPKPQHIPLAKLWLERSCGKPLSLKLYQSSGKEGEQEEQAVQTLLELFVQQFARWRSIRLCLTGKSSSALSELRFPDEAVLTAATLQRPIFGGDHDENSSCISAPPQWHLRSAALTLPAWELPDISTLWRKLYAVPSLRKVDWTDCYKLRTPPDVPWGQLTHVTLGRNFTVNAALEVLPICKELISLTASLTLPRMIPAAGGLAAAVNGVAFGGQGGVGANDDPPSIPDTTLPNLKTLVITVVDPRVGEVLDRLTLPSLRQLDLFQGRTERLSGMESVLNLLKRSECHLSSLSIIDAYMAEKDVIDLLASPSISPSLRELEVWAPFTDTIARALSIDSFHDQDQTPVTLGLSSDGDVAGTQGCGDGIRNGAKSNLLPALRQIYIGRCCASEGQIPKIVASRVGHYLPSGDSYKPSSSRSGVAPAKLRRLGIHFSGANKGKGDVEKLKEMDLDVDIF